MVADRGRARPCPGAGGTPRAGGISRTLRLRHARSQLERRARPSPARDQAASANIQGRPHRPRGRRDRGGRCRRPRPKLRNGRRRRSGSLVLVFGEGCKGVAQGYRRSPGRLRQLGRPGEWLALRPSILPCWPGIADTLSAGISDAGPHGDSDACPFPAPRGFGTVTRFRSCPTTTYAGSRRRTRFAVAEDAEPQRLTRRFRAVLRRCLTCTRWRARKGAAREIPWNLLADRLPAWFRAVCRAHRLSTLNPGSENRRAGHALRSPAVCHRASRPSAQFRPAARRAHSITVSFIEKLSIDLRDLIFRPCTRCQYARRLGYCDRARRHHGWVLCEGRLPRTGVKMFAYGRTSWPGSRRADADHQRAVDTRPHRGCRCTAPSYHCSRSMAILRSPPTRSSPIRRTAICAHCAAGGAPFHYLKGRAGYLCRLKIRQPTLAALRCRSAFGRRTRAAKSAPNASGCSAAARGAAFRRSAPRKAREARAGSLAPARGGASDPAPRASRAFLGRKACPPEALALPAGIFIAAAPLLPRAF